MEKGMGKPEAGKMRLGMAVTLLGGIFWGFSGCCGQYMFENQWIDAKWLVNVRLLLAGAILSAAGFLRDGRHQLDIFRSRQDLTRMVVFALAGITLSQYCYFMTVQASNAGTATILQYLNPSMILVLVCLRDQRLPRPMEVVAIVLSLGGTFVLGTHGDITQLHIAGDALFYGLLSAVAAVLYSMLPGDLIPRYGICQTLGFGMILGGICLLGFVRPWEYAISWSLPMLLALAGVVVLGTAAAYGMYLWGVSLIGPLKGGLLASIEPVAALVISVIWLKTKVETMDVLGFAMIMTTVLLLSWKKEEI